MSQRSKRWTMRDLKQCLRALDCHVERESKHEIWRTRAGETLPALPHSNRDNEIIHVKSIRTFFEARGIDIDRVAY